MNKLGLILLSSEMARIPSANRRKRTKRIVKGDPVETDEGPFRLLRILPMVEYRLIRWPTPNMQTSASPFSLLEGASEL